VLSAGDDFMCFKDNLEIDFSKFLVLFFDNISIDNEIVRCEFRLEWN